MSTFTVGSSNGTITVSIETGNVIYVNLWKDGDSTITRIWRFDIKEWEKYREETIEEGEEIDILDLGYWCDGKREDESTWEYEEPAWDWRELVNAEQ